MEGIIISNNINEEIGINISPNIIIKKSLRPMITMKEDWRLINRSLMRRMLYPMTKTYLKDIMAHQTINWHL